MNLKIKTHEEKLSFNRNFISRQTIQIGNQS